MSDSTATCGMQYAGVCAVLGGVIAGGGVANGFVCRGGHSAYNHLHDVVDVVYVAVLMVWSLAAFGLFGFQASGRCCIAAECF